MLGAILKDLPRPAHPDLLVGLNTADDAGVFRISPDTALIQTVDFFTPIVDDPYLYGQIAAANSLSDVYAMGGRPVTALNICAFPDGEIEPEVIAKVLLGGHDKVAEAGAVVAGGHTVDDAEPKYGLAVTGVVHPDRVVTNAGARPGDRLVLTKPLGTGLMSDAYIDEEEDVGEADIREGCESMALLNASASQAMVKHGAHACTDVTGFGLIGHGMGLARASGVSLRVRASAVPFFELAMALAERRQGGGLRRNRMAYEPHVGFSGDVSEAWRRLLFDPQTSGGLLIAVAEGDAGALLTDLLAAGLRAAEIGEVVERVGEAVQIGN